MFNLVKYRYIFLGISLLVIIPGVISLLLFRLNVGIDFTMGSRVELRPQQNLTEQQVRDYLTPFKLDGLQVLFGNSLNKDDGAKTAWISLNTRVDDNVDKTLRDNLTKKFPEVKIQRSVLKNNDGKLFDQYTVTAFASVPKQADIEAAVKDLPKTTDATTSAATATPAATSTPSATATSTATATATATNPQATIPVTATVQTGQTNQLIDITSLSTITTNSGAAKSTTVQDIQSAVLKAGGPNLYVVSASQVGPSVAAETTRNAALAVVAASFFILLYVWFSFRKIPKAIRYAICAIVALLHDVLVVLGIFSILGHFFGIQIDALFITALLTVIGFSVHDTIVVFDRIRENMQRHTVESFDEVVNASLVQTMARSLNTSLTVLLTLLALYLFSGIGTDIHTFTLTLLIGIFSGTYSSIFNASMLLVIWEKGELGLSHLGGGEKPVTRREIRERELARSRA